MDRHTEMKHAYNSITAPDGAMEMFDMVAWDQPEKVTFKVDDMSKAEWAVSRIAFYEKCKVETTEFVEAEIEKLKAYLTDHIGRYDKQINYLSGLLREYAADKLKDSKKKSLDLPSGTLQFKKVQPKYERKEEDLFIFVKNNYPDFIVTKESVAWNEFKNTLKIADGRAVTSDGEVLDCVTVITPDEDTFSVKIKGE